MNTPEPADDELIARSRTDPDALDELFRRRAPAVFKFLARRVGVAEAEDLLGEVFVNVVSSRGRYRPHGSGSALPWLYGIATNVVRANLRRRKPEARVDVDAGVDWDAVDDRLDAHASRHRLAEALSALTGSEREVLLLVVLEGLTNLEVAEVLKVSPTVVRTRLRRARKRAQTVLDAGAATEPAVTPVALTAL